MKRAGIYIAAALFLLAAGAKLLYPQETADLLRGNRNTEPEQTEAVETVATTDTVGKAVTRTINAGDYLAQAGLTAEDGAQADVESGGVTEAAGTEPEEETPVLMDVVDPSELSEEVEQAVAVFLAAQAEFADEALPVNVSYEVCRLPFTYVAPVDSVTSSGFGYRVHPLEDVTKFHYGTDFASNSGDDIHCFADGFVAEVGQDDSYGNYLRVDHGDGYSTLYAHCGKIYVTDGQVVRAGEKIALVGATGQVTGPHLHFELTQNGIYMNPEFYLAGL